MTVSNRDERESNLASIVDSLTEDGFHVDLDDDLLFLLSRAGLTSKNQRLAVVATQILSQEKPITLRGLFYRVVSAGVLPSTDAVHYQRLGRVMTTLRERKAVPFTWLVDNVRASLKPSSWSGIEDFVDTVRRAYRKDFWSQLPDYVHVIVEKDAIAGVIQPITEELDVTLSPIRGYASLSFVNEIASTWNRIHKPIHVAYLGDFDPSGFDLERDLQEKLERYCRRPFEWTRLGVNAEDFRDFNLLPLPVKHSDKRAASFIEAHGHAGAELDAIPSNEIRSRVDRWIRAFIPQPEWERLELIEWQERQTFAETLGQLSPHRGSGS